jgi:thymidylate synthase
MKQYLDALNHVMKHGEYVKDRTGTGTKTVFGHQMRFDLQEGFPAVTTKKLAWRAVVGELLWFLEGSEDERRLAEITYEDDREFLMDKTTIWTANADKQGKDLGYPDGMLGPVYGAQWRNWNDDYIDQIENIINLIKNEPDSRRIILSAWNAGKIDEMALPPCHTMAQFRVINGKLSCQLYQRSADMFLGVPFNIASYSLLTHMLAQICGLKVGEFVWTGGDCHIYKNHQMQVREQLQRQPRLEPKLKMPEFSTLEELLQTRPSEYQLVGYNPMDSIKAPMAV